MANQEQLEILKSGVENWNKWRKDNINTLIDLVRVNLSGVNFSGVNLSGAKLNQANLEGADLSYANLVGANLTAANLSGANLKGADLSGAKLSDTDLSDTNLEGANLEGANLSYANLKGTNLEETNFEEDNIIGSNLKGIFNPYGFEAFILKGSNQAADRIFNIDKIDDACFGDSGEIMEQPKIISDQVEFSVYSPETITSGSNFILDVWASFLHQSSEVLKEAKSLGREKRLGVKKGISVSLGANLEVSVNIDSLEIEDPYDTLEWKGAPINASFSVHVPEETKVGSYNGKAIISYDSIVIAKVIFLIYIGKKEKMDYENINQTTFYPKSAFASYSSEDRIAVLSRIDGMKKIAPNIDVFCDVLTLRSGEDWLERIKEEVSAKDIFYLFWSHHAAKSEWVEKEWRLALNERGIEYIDPVPLEDVDIAPPPPELKKKHFSSNLSNLIQILEWKKHWKENRLND